MLCTAMQSDNTNDLEYGRPVKGVQKKVESLRGATMVNHKISFAGACSGRSGQVSGEASRWSRTGGSWNAYTNHCTAHVHAVSASVATSCNDVKYTALMPVPVGL